jgi:hypothetical protein
MPTTASVSGSIVIKGVSIPVSTMLPPPASGNLIFKYDLPADTSPTETVSVGDFISWAADELGISAFTLPASLEELSLGVSHLLIDTGGKFQIGVLFGSTQDGKWNPAWKPISALPFSFENLELEVDYGPATPTGVSLTTTAAAAAAATELTFASTTGVTTGMSAAGTSLAANTTVTAVAATTVTLSAATTAAVPVGTSINFTPAA